MDLFIYLSVFLLIALSLILARRELMSFRGQRASDYLGLGPDFKFDEHLAGHRICEGVIFGPMGRVVSRFCAEMNGEWSGDTGTLTVDFRYDSGATQHRAWTVRLRPGGKFEAEAEDIVGIGQGRIMGPALGLQYRILLPEDSGGHSLKVTDWMYLSENGTILNRSEFRKYGIRVAELVATIRAAD